jgi:Ca-activated chloride channel homolog
MKQNLEKLLKQQAPPPDPAARVRARRAALEAFAQVVPEESAAKPEVAKSKGLLQGILAALRLSRNESGRDTMPWYSNKTLLGSAASLSMATIALMLAWPLIEQNKGVALREEFPLPPPAASGPRDVPQETPAVAEPPQLASEKERAGRDLDERRLTPPPARQAAEPVVAAPKSEEEVVVTGMRRQAAATLESKQATTEYVEVVSAEEISRLSENNAADAPPASPSATAQQEQAKQKDSSGDMDELVVVTGARANRVSAAPPKGAPAKPRGEPLLGRADSRQPVAPAPAAPPPASIASGLTLAYSDEGRDRFEHFDSSSVKLVSEEPVSTFSADVDTASYSFVRRQLNANVLPARDAVRVEEMINYFRYAWPLPAKRSQPFQPTIVVSDSPWGEGKKLVHIGIKGFDLTGKDKPDANLVLLLDVSGSMASADKLPLAVRSMELLLESLKPTDTVGIVVYAGAAGLVLAPTPVSEKQQILDALRSLRPGGSTAGAQGIELAYQLAEKHFRKDGVNRILLATDGDFNVGISDRDELKHYVERKRANGVGLSVLGYGQGNYRDELAQALAQNGNGVAAYIDSEDEARRVLVEQASSALFTIAKDVKLQVEFNPAAVHEYRLVGYETRALKREDFNNDAVDAGDVGAGHSVTAIYEITPVGSAARSSDPLRYGAGAPAGTENDARKREYGFLKIRYKLPDGNKSILMETPIPLETPKVPAQVLRDVGFSTAVAGFGQLLRGGAFTGKLSFDDVATQARAAEGPDAEGDRAEFLGLVLRAKRLSEAAKP